MAEARETVAWSKCEGEECGKPVAVKVNVSGLAYYRCDHCGRKVEHKLRRTSDAYLAKVAPKKSEPAPPAPVKTNNPPPPAPERRSAGTVLG